MISVRPVTEMYLCNRREYKLSVFNLLCARRRHASSTASVRRALPALAGWNWRDPRQHAAAEGRPPSRPRRRREPRANKFLSWVGAAANLTRSPGMERQRRGGCADAGACAADLAAVGGEANIAPNARHLARHRVRRADAHRPCAGQSANMGVSSCLLLDASVDAAVLTVVGGRVVDGFAPAASRALASPMAPWTAFFLCAPCTVATSRRRSGARKPSGGSASCAACARRRLRPSVPG